MAKTLMSCAICRAAVFVCAKLVNVYTSLSLDISVSIPKCLALPFSVLSYLQVTDLLALQQRSKDGVIKMTPDVFSKLVTGKQRPFALYMFLTANHLVDNPNMRLRPMRQDFGYMAKALKERIASGAFKSPGTIFFAEAEFQDSQEVGLFFAAIFNRIMQ